MIAHLVLFRFKPGVSKDDNRVQEVVAGMNGLPAHIALIRGWEHGCNLTEDPQACDYGLRALFETDSDLHAYFDHPDHLAVVKQWEAIADLIFCDHQV